MVNVAVDGAQKSDPGRDPEKQVNEDACAQRATKLGYLSVVCDGMGGHAGGREASNLALQTIFERVENTPPGTPPGEALRLAIAEANRRVAAMSTKDVSHGKPGSTAVAVLVHPGGTELAHVGDSRCYLVHAGQIFQVSKDHSMVQELVDLGVLTPAQAAVHPDANKITRALGMAPEVEVEVRPQPLTHVTGDAFVLCSDGLSDLVEPQEILRIVGSAPPAQAVGQLVDLANARGGHDNVTVQVVRPRESALASTQPLAPTVAQTQVPKTLVLEQHGERMTEPSIPAAAALQATSHRPPVVPPAPPSSMRAPRRGRWLTPGVVIGLALAIFGLAAAGVVLYMHVMERGGKKSAPAPALELDAGDGD